MSDARNPSYRLSWTPERRKAASDKSKAWWAAKWAREKAEADRERMSLLGKIRDAKREQLARKERARAAYFAAEAQALELQTAEDAIVGTLRVLRRHGLSGEVG